MKARTIAEVVAGEMTHGPYAMSDALGIASVIANRAKAYGVPPESVITSGQFNAYGKSLPKGVGPAQIAMAQKAIDTVAANGPVTPATHYARPEAAKNIKGWSSFKQVDKVPGSHVYAIDPAMRPVVTAQGVMQAQPNAFQDLMGAATQNAIKVAHTVAAIPQAAAEMAKRGYEAVTGQPSQLERAVEESAGNVAGLYAGGLQFSRPNESSIQPGLRNSLIGASAEMGRPLGITSGHRSVQHNIDVRGAKGSYHVSGQAADIDMAGMTVPERQQLVSDLMQRGVTRFGTYDNSNMLHVDIGAPPPGQIAHFMHERTKNNMANAPGWFQGLAGSVLANNALPTPDAATAPTPTPAPRAPAVSQGTTPAVGYGRMADSMGAAGVPHIGLSPAMAASMQAPAGTTSRVGTAAPAFDANTQALSQTKPASSPMIDTKRGLTGPLASPAPASPFGKLASPQTASVPALSPNDRISQAFDRQVDVRSLAAAPAVARAAAAPAPTPSLSAVPQGGSVLGRMPGGMEANIAGAGPAHLSPQGQAQVAAMPTAPTPVPAPATPAPAPATPAPSAIPQDPGIAARISLPPGEVRPSLVETGALVAGQPAPALSAPTVVADQPVQTVKETAQVSPTTIAPAPTIAPAAPPPAQPGGLLGALQEYGAPLAAPFTKPFRAAASLAGPTPNPEPYTFGIGAKAISDVLSGVGQDKPGATAYSKSTPGYSIKSLGNGMVEKTNQYGAKSYEHVGTPGSGILSGQAQPGGWRGGFGLSGLGMPSAGGMMGGIGSTLGRMALSGIGGAVAGPIGAIAAPMIFGGMLNNVMTGMTAGSGGGWGNTANSGPSAMGYAGPWGGGGTSSSGRASSSGGGGWAGGGMGGRASSPGSSGWGGSGGKKK